MNKEYLDEVFSEVLHEYRKTEGYRLNFGVYYTPKYQWAV